MVYGAVPVKDEENPLLGVRSSSKRPRSFAYGVIAVVCVAALAISGFSRSTDRSSREDLSALGDLSNDYLAKRSWWQDVKTANETLITAKQASDKAMEAAAEAEEKFGELKLDAEEKDRMCTDIHKAEDQTSGATTIVPPALSRHRVLGSFGPGPGLRGGGLLPKSCEAAKKAAEAKKAKCMETCKSLDCGLPKCKNAPAHRTCPPAYSGDRCKTGFDLYAGKPYRNRWWHVGITGVDESRKYFKCLGTYCNPPIGREYYFPDKRTNKCTERVVIERKDTWGRLKSYHTVGVGSDYLSECGKCTD